jgi:hypothetical protein
MLTIKNYKEPLKEIKNEDGFGYYGTLLQTDDSELVQCHYCGKLFEHLASHVLRAHKDIFSSLSEYRDKYELAKSTALVSDSIRLRMKANTIKQMANLTDEQKKEHKKHMRELWKMDRSSGGKKGITLETKNKRGTCPDQLLEKIKVVADSLGRSPTMNDFRREADNGNRYIQLIQRTFGTWNKALKMLNLATKKTGNKGESKDWKRPTYSDYELLEYLRIYAQENQSLPTATDCLRGYIPTFGVYKRRFGSLEKARQLAGIEFILNK